MKRQLATEWLEKELQNLDVDFESGIVTKPTYFERRASIVEQAKQKELGNLEDAFYEGIGSGKYQRYSDIFRFSFNIYTKIRNEDETFKNTTRVERSIRKLEYI